jgi:ubiquinone/menaquinone biosynthesis C-methylase UbiE
VTGLPSDKRNTPAALDALLRNEADLSFRRRVPIILDYLDPQPGDAILDCGCGMGFNVRTLASLYDVAPIGVERNPVTLARAKVELQSTSARLVRADALRLPFRDASFDKVLMTEVLEHIPDEAAALREIWRVLRPGGTYVLSVPNENYPFWWDPINKTLEKIARTHVPSHIWWLAGIWADHVRLYSKRGIRAALESRGFQVTDIVAYTHYCLPFHHMLVYGIGKNLLQGGLLPDGLARSADRFRSDENSGSILNPINAAVRLVHWIDRRNDGLVDARLSYVDISVRATKPISS